jgi:DNA modification methylase
MENKKKGGVKYINKIIKAKVSPVRKGELMEESKKQSYKFIMELIRIMENNPELDIVDAKLKLKNIKPELF